MYRILNVLHSLGLVGFIFTLTLLFPWVFSAFYWKDGAQGYFLDTFIVSATLCAVISLVTIPFRKELLLREGLLMVFLVWVIFPIIGGAPFYLASHLMGHGFDITHAYFEGVSSLTTTGSTTITDIEHLPKSLLLWRHSLAWFGGMGILLLAVAILPLLGVGGQQLMKGEMPGPLKEEKLTPRIRNTAKALYAIYVGASLLCCLAYHITGLDWFSAWCHAAATMSLSGMSIYNDGFKHIDSAGVDSVAIFFMLFAGINFATHFKVIQKGSFKYYLTCPETMPFLIIVVGSAICISLYLYISQTYPTLFDAFHFGFFNTVSVATTNGFANDDYLMWPSVLPLWMLMLGMFATSAGSTGGGIRIIRIILIVKQIAVEMRRLIHPHGVFPVHLRRQLVSPTMMTSILIFLLLYIVCLVVITTLYFVSGLEPVTAATAAMANLANTGVALGDVGPFGSFAIMNDFQLWVSIIAMVVGRLELFTVFVIFTPAFWRT